MTREPTVDEVVGTYELYDIHVDMVASGLSDKIRNNGSKSIIVLRSDGTAAFKNFPFFEEQSKRFRYRFTGFYDADAKWKIAVVGGVSYKGGKDYKQVYGLSFKFSDSRELFDWPSLTGNKDVDGLIFTLYDGDQGEILGFKKV